MINGNAALQGVVPQPNVRKVNFLFRMVDGGPFIIVTEETWSQKMKRVFIVHGQTVDELTNVYSYFEGRYCLLVGSDSGQLDIRYSEVPGAELTRNIQSIYWTPRACYTQGREVHPIRLELLTSEQCRVELGVDGSVQRVSVD